MRVLKPEEDVADRSVNWEREHGLHIYIFDFKFLKNNLLHWCINVSESI